MLVQARRAVAGRTRTTHQAARQSHDAREWRAGFLLSSSKGSQPSVNDIVVFTATVASFALLVSAHCAIAYGLAKRPPRARALVAFVVAPLAPYWALRERMWVRAGIWIVGVVVYVVARIVQRD